MNQILALREKRANLWNQTKAFLDSHRGEDGIRDYKVTGVQTCALPIY